MLQLSFELTLGLAFWDRDLVVCRLNYLKKKNYRQNLDANLIIVNDYNSTNYIFIGYEF